MHLITIAHATRNLRTRGSNTKRSTGVRLGLSTSTATLASVPEASGPCSKCMYVGCVL